MNFLDILVDLESEEDVARQYSLLVLVNVVETFRHIIDKDIGFDKVELYNSVLALLCILWINANPPSNFKHVLPKVRGCFILEVSIIKGVWKKDEDTFIDHEWVDVGELPLVITNPMGHENRERRVLLDIGPYLEKRVLDDRADYSPQKIIDIEQGSERVLKTIEFKGEKISLKKYAQDLFLTKFPES